MSSNPKVSVVMSVYNNAAMLRETVESVLCQTVADFEFVIINDGSTEPEVVSLLGDLSTEGKRIELINKPNQGLTAALVDGCEKASGEFIARVDVGDVMHPKRLEKQIELFAQNPAAVLVSCWVEVCAPEWEMLWCEKGIAGDISKLGIAEQLAAIDEKKIDIPHHGSVMFRRSAYKEAEGYRREFYFAQDWDLWHRLTKLGSFEVVPEVLYKARLMPNGISSIHRNQQLACLSESRNWLLASSDSERKTCLERASSVRPTSPSEATKNSSDSAAGWYFIGEALRRNGDKKASFYLQAAIKAKPLFWKAWMRYIQAKLLLR